MNWNEWGEVENVSIILASSKDKVSFPSMFDIIMSSLFVVSLSEKYSQDIHERILFYVMLLTNSFFSFFEMSEGIFARGRFKGVVALVLGWQPCWPGIQRKCLLTNLRTFLSLWHGHHSCMASLFQRVFSGLRSPRWTLVKCKPKLKKFVSSRYLGRDLGTGFHKITDIHVYY